LAADAEFLEMQKLEEYNEALRRQGDGRKRQPMSRESALVPSPAEPLLALEIVGEGTGGPIFCDSKGGVSMIRMHLTLPSSRRVNL